MKNIKRLSLIAAVCIILSSVICVSAFAADDSSFIIDTDVIYAVVPDDYEFTPYSDTYYYFEDVEDWDSISYIVIENTVAPEGITALSSEEAQSIFYSAFIDDGYDTYETDYESEKKTKINGMSAYMLQGSYYDGYTYPFCAYLFATEENIVIVVYEDIDEVITDNDDINEALSALVINGTYFEGDAPTLTHDFTDAIPFSDAMQNDLDAYVFGDYPNVEWDGEMSTVFISTCVVMFILPFIAVLVVAIVMIVKYIGKKKKLRKYESAYGSNPVSPTGYNYNAGMPVNNNNYTPYSYIPQQPPVTPEQTNAPYGAAPIKQQPQTGNIPEAPQSTIAPELRETENKEN